MSHKAAFMLGKIDRAEFDELSMLKEKDPEAYERREKELGASRSQLVSKYGEQGVERAEKEFGRAREMATEHMEETQHKGVGTLDADLARATNRRLFGTRQDGRVYPKDKMPTLDFRGRVGRIGIYEGIISQFKKIARDNKLPEAYGYRLVNDVSTGTLQIRYHLTREQVGELKGVARELLRKEEGGE